MLAQIISWILGASSSWKRFSTHAGTPSTPVAFLGFKNFNIVFTCPMLGSSGSWSIISTSANLADNEFGTRLAQGAINASSNLFAVDSNSICVVCVGEEESCFSVPHNE